MSIPEHISKKYPWIRDLANEYLKTKYSRKPDQCAYRNCKNIRTPENRLYRFPQNSNSRLKTWIKNAGNPKILHWKWATIQRAGLCRNHFKPEDFFNDSRQKLLPSAVPIPFYMHEEPLKNNTYVNLMQDDSLNNLEFSNVEIEISPCSQDKPRPLITHSGPSHQNNNIHNEEVVSVTEQSKFVRKLVLLRRQKSILCKLIKQISTKLTLARIHKHKLQSKLLAHFNNTG
ncbi:uncharacterized protein [Venturia canescens]|uniref:uncharacterized protein n=1 Tax=Venturia canescens TaxID=32260 RepID=UPI001C9C3E5E|nr:uncharacterized protein LOC122409944 [Venturia canescens]